MNWFILVISVITGYSIYWGLDYLRRREAQKIAATIKDQACQQADNRQRQLYDQLCHETEQKRRNSYSFVRELKESNDSLKAKLDLREKNICYWEQKLKQVQASIESQEQRLQNRRHNNIQLDQFLQSQQKQSQATLLSRSGYKLDQIKQLFLQEFADTVKLESEAYNKRYLQYILANAERIAARIISTAIHRCQFGHWSETYPSSLSFVEPEKAARLLSEPIQKVFQEQLEISLEYDHKTAILAIVTGSGSKREIARRVLEEMLVSDDFSAKNLHPLIDEYQFQMERDISRTGKEQCRRLGLELSANLSKLLGRLKYRTSFGQNVLAHSLEVAYLAKLMAVEIGLDVAKACRAGLLHDIGKAVDHEQEGGHPEIGGEILAHFHEDPEIIQGVIGHHEDIHLTTPYATIINAADAISASRPGARRETFEKYIKRLEKLEAIAYSIPGTENAYAISAGREIRVMIDPDKISAQETGDVANQIARAVEDELHYPGKIKITVIRELKVVEYAS